MKDQDLDRWMTAWRDGTPPAEGLARMAQRERRLLTAWIAFDWAVGAGLIAFAAWIWFAIGTPVMRFTAVGIVVLTIAVLAFTIVNWGHAVHCRRHRRADDRRARVHDRQLARQFRG